MIYKFRKTRLGVNVDEEPAQSSHMPVIKKLKRRKVYEKFEDNIWVADLPKIGSLSCNNWGVNIICDRFFYQICLGQTFEW